MRITFLSSLLILTAHCVGQVNGYVITPAGDSIPVQIKVYKALFGINYDHYFRGVEVEDSSGILKTYDAADLRAFGFVYKSKRYDFYSKPFEVRNFVDKPTDTTIRFLIAWIKGPKASVYEHDQSGGGSNGSEEAYYTFEKEGNAYMWLTNYARLSTMQEKLAAFYSGYPGVPALIRERFTSRGQVQKDIKAVIDKVNGQ